MLIKVTPHQVKIVREETEPINEKEVNISKCTFEFSDEITDDYVKEAYFTLNGNTYKQIISNNQCDYPQEVLAQKGELEIGVTVYKIEDEEYVKLYNPTPDYYETWKGSMKEAQNTEPITPTDKEQIEQMLSNINLSINKEGKITTISFTNTDGETQTETLEDGIGLEFNWQGTSLGVRQEGQSEYQYVNLQGQKGEPGAIKFEIVETLPTENIKEDTIYLVPITPDTQGNNYAEYIYVNGAWELLGKIGVQIDLTNYVQFTDYATESVAGVMRIGGTGRTFLGSNHQILPSILSYSTYSSANDYVFIGKGTLENVIAGKGLVSNTDYATNDTAGVFKTYTPYGTYVNASGYLMSTQRTYAQYQTDNGGTFISKATLDNVLTATIGDIQTLLDNLDVGNGVE